MIHVYHGDGKGKTTAAMGLALRMLAAGRRVVVVQFLKDGESGEVRLLAEHFGVPVFAGKASDKFTWSMTSEELAATCELHDGNLAPALVVGVPVGFVNVVEAKEELLARRVPAIVARGRKGGSTVAAAIMNALLYQITRTGGPK